MELGRSLPLPASAAMSNAMAPLAGCGPSSPSRKDARLGEDEFVELPRVSAIATPSCRASPDSTARGGRFRVRHGDGLASSQHMREGGIGLSEARDRVRHRLSEPIESIASHVDRLPHVGDSVRLGASLEVAAVTKRANSQRDLAARISVLSSARPNSGSHP
jgi:hypothetical protein